MTTILHFWDLLKDKRDCESLLSFLITNIFIALARSLSCVNNHQFLDYAVMTVSDSDSETEINSGWWIGQNSNQRCSGPSR